MNIKKIIVVFIFIINSFAHSQNVEVTITNVKVNNVSIPTGSEINFNNNSTVQLNFRVELEKLASFSIGNCKLRIRTYRSSGSYIEHFQGNVSPSNFVESTFGDYQYTLYASDYDAGIGNYLTAVLVQDNSPGTAWTSNPNITISKEPKFTLSPTTLALSCDDTNVKNFTVTPSNIPAGATVTYQWSFSGWSGTATSSMSSVNLTPISGTTLPSSVTVTPFINGVAKPSMSCIVSRGSFNPNYTITGNNQGCPGTATPYSIAVGTYTVSWSVSNYATQSLLTLSTIY